MKLSNSWIIGGFTAGGIALAVVPSAIGYVSERWETYKEANCTESMPGCAPKSTFRIVTEVPGVPVPRQDGIGDLIKSLDNTNIPQSLQNNEDVIGGLIKSLENKGGEKIAGGKTGRLPTATPTQP